MLGVGHGGVHRDRVRLSMASAKFPVSVSGNMPARRRCVCRPSARSRPAHRRIATAARTFAEARHRLRQAHGRSLTCTWRCRGRMRWCAPDRRGIARRGAPVSRSSGGMPEDVHQEPVHADRRHERGPATGMVRRGGSRAADQQPSRAIRKNNSGWRDHPRRPTQPSRLQFAGSARKPAQLRVGYASLRRRWRRSKTSTASASCGRKPATRFTTRRAPHRQRSRYWSPPASPRGRTSAAPASAPQSATILP